MPVLVEWGNPLTGFWTYQERRARESEVEHGQRIEATHTIVQREPLTIPEMEMVVSEFVGRMRDEHPEHDVRYVAIEEGSPLTMKVHLEERSPVPIGTILEIIVASVFAVLVAKFGWEVWKIIESAAEEIKEFGGNPVGYAVAHPGRTALIIGAPIAGLVVVDRVFFD